MIDYYKVLGVERTATLTQIKAAYRKLARQHHPDRNGNDAKAAKKMADVNTAYNCLSDPECRAEYDAGVIRAKQPTPRKVKALKLFDEIMGQCREEPGNIVTNVRRLIDKGLRGGRKEEQKVKARIEALDVRMRALRVPDGVDNVIGHALRAHQLDGIKALKEIGEVIQALHDVQDMIDGITSVEDEVPEQPQEEKRELGALLAELIIGGRPRHARGG